jgi:regulator of protease activity HflC (stomatin/prohibitin superfamily)
MNALIVILVILAVVVKSAIYILKEYERGVVFQFGKLNRVRGPGIVFIIPFVEKIVKVDQRTVTMDVPSQDVITRDNVTIKVSAVLYFRVMEPGRALVQIENYLYATSQLAQTTLRSVCGEAELDEILSKRDELNSKIQDIVDKQTEPWGVKVSLVEIKHIDLPQEMQRAMAKQAEAERERRAKVIQAEGEYQAAQKLADAAQILSTQAGSLQLRYLDTLRSIATEQNSTILFPVPLDLLEGLKQLGNSLTKRD